MLVGHRTDLPAGAGAALVPLGVEALADTLGWVAVTARPNARVTLGFWLLSLSVEAGAADCLAADLVSTPVRCCCACCC